MKQYEVIFYGVPDIKCLKYVLTARDRDDLLEQIRELIQQKPNLDFEEYKYYPLVDNR